MGNYILKFIEENNLNLYNQPIVVGVSTGIDSIVLLDELIRIQDKLKLDIIVAHINHQMREQSTQEEEFIKKLCSNNNLKIYTTRFDFAIENPGNFQAQARKKRFEFFAEVLEKENSKYLFLGHHANDNIETIIMRLIRGSNLLGYAGIQAISDFKSYKVIRPLLGVTKEKIKAIAQNRNLKYYTDESNLDYRYTRNRIRHQIVPLLFQENENVDEQFAHFASLINNASDITEQYVMDFIKNSVTFNKQKLSFDRKLFLSKSLFIQREILFTLTKKHSLGMHNIDEILKLINSEKPNLLVQVKQNLTFAREYNKIYLLSKEVKEKNIEITIDKCGIFPVDENREIIVEKKSNNKLTNLNTLWYNNIMLPITVRTRQEGDRIQLHSGSKRISRYLIDEKIGILSRNDILVAVDNNDEILAIFGYEKSSLLKEIKKCDITITLKEKD